MRLRILFHNCRLLHPLHGGDRIRTCQMLRELRKKHHVTYLTLRTPADDESAVGRASEYCDELITVPHPETNRRSLGFYLRVAGNTLWGRYPYHSRRYLSREAVQRLAQLTAPGHRPAFDLAVCDYLAPMANFLELPAKPAVPILLFQHNVESKICERHARTGRAWVKRAVYRRHWKMLRKFEQQSAALVDGQVAVSEADAAYFRNDLGMANVLGAVPTGVDCEYFQPPAKPPAKPVLAFLGSMDWEANQDAVNWFNNDIFPRIRAQIPEAEFLIIGRNPPPRLQALAEKGAGVRTTGTVPDVRPYMAEAAAMVLPLRVGGGTRIKVYEAMAMGVPVISTTIGAEGLDVTHGKDLLLADTSDAFVKQTVALLRDPAQAATLAAEARRQVAENYSWARVAEIFANYCAQVAAKRRA